MDQQERMHAKLARLRVDAERLTRLAVGDQAAAREAKEAASRHRGKIAAAHENAVHPEVDHGAATAAARQREAAELAAMDAEATALAAVAAEASRRAANLRKLVRRCEEYLGARATGADSTGSWELPSAAAQAMAQRVATAASGRTG
jgi:hypothetical protein